MIRTLNILCLAAIMGVVLATGLSCGIGLMMGTDTWCGLHWVWPFAFPVAIGFALVVGLPVVLLFRKLGFIRWWQFAMGGLVIALPFWWEAAQPFMSARWSAAGFFDSVNYLGSGVAAGLVYWFLSNRRNNAL